MKTARIDDGTTASLINNTSLWESLPFLKAAHTRLVGIKPPDTKCSVCRKKAINAETYKILEDVRTRICALTPDKRKIIKDALNATELKVTLITRAGQQTYTL